MNEHYYLIAKQYSDGTQALFCPVCERYVTRKWKKQYANDHWEYEVINYGNSGWVHKVKESE